MQFIGYAPNIKSLSDRDRAISIAEAISRMARKQSEALSVTLGSQGNSGTQHDLNRIACEAENLLRMLKRPQEFFDKKIHPFESNDGV